MNPKYMIEEYDFLDDAGDSEYLDSLYFMYTALMTHYPLNIDS